jgi:hypothetical protein
MNEASKSSEARPGQERPPSLKDWGASLIVRASRLLRTQDNRGTAHPVFVVQQRQRICGVDDGYTEEFVWMDQEWNEVHDPELIEQLESAGQLDSTKGYTRIGYLDIWEFVTACFTEQGCKDYIALNGHNLREPRIYVESAHRNHEWQAVRALLGKEPSP